MSALPVSILAQLCQLIPLRTAAAGRFSSFYEKFSEDRVEIESKIFS